MTNPQEILEFWFLPPTHDDYGKPRQEWFVKNPEFDQLIVSSFLDTFEKAEQGYLLSWTDSSEGSLALILLFDQFSRNMFRDMPRAFATDAKALEISRHMIKSGQYEKLETFQKPFAALPFEHSETLEDQQASIQMFENIGIPESLDYAIRHYDIIKRFERFPHRNHVLQRESTLEEIEFLKEPGSSF